MNRLEEALRIDRGQMCNNRLMPDSRGCPLQVLLGGLALRTLGCSSDQAMSDGAKPATLAGRIEVESHVQAELGRAMRQVAGPSEGRRRAEAARGVVQANGKLGYGMTRESDDDKESELQHALTQVARLSVADQYGPLIELCTELIGRFPEEPTLYYERGQARQVLGLPRPALDDMSKAVERKPKEIKFLFFRGLWSLELGVAYTTAVLDFTTIIELEDASDPSGFCEPARLSRALAHLSLGQFDLAERDLDHLESEDRADDEMWVGRKCWTVAEMRELVAQRRRPS